MVVNSKQLEPGIERIVCQHSSGWHMLKSILVVHFRSSRRNEDCWLLANILTSDSIYWTCFICFQGNHKKDVFGLIVREPESTALMAYVLNCYSEAVVCSQMLRYWGWLGSKHQRTY